MKVGINGFGRIGRSVFRILENMEGIDVVAINDLFDNDALRYLLSYDTVMGPFGKNLKLEDDHFVTDKGRVKLINERNPADLPWKELGVDVVVEATGVFRKREQLEAHLQAGASQVVLTVPSKDPVDYTVVLGVNDEGLDPSHRIISNASCTTNCLAPMARVLNDEFGIEEGVINTVHAYTNDQRLADVPHSDWRRSRAAAENIIPTSTGAAKAVGQVLPDLQGKLHGIAARVPVPDGSVVDLFVKLGKSVTVDDVNAVVRAASESERLKGILQYSEVPIVSSDIIGNSHSSIYDAGFSGVTAGSLPEGAQLVRQRVGLFLPCRRPAGQDQDLVMPGSGEPDYSGLRSNVSNLGRILGETIAGAEGEDFLALIERIRGLSKGARDGSDADRDQLLAQLRALDGEQLVPVARAFAQFLNLANIADQQYRVSRGDGPYPLRLAQPPQQPRRVARRGRVGRSYRAGHRRSEDRTGAHRPPHRDHPSHTDSQAQ